ncbi:MAG: copper amine oxidase N-terminal domain-containing protein [Syntrophomonadaceae bacterium]|nr:copper amine oxidase N-terminal domain-containing protein [Syntrophomonadaceae bacterium]
MKKRLILVVAVFMVLAFAAGTIAAPAVQDVTATLAGDIKFFVNGKDWQPKDVDGSIMTPIIYNGRTYLPARAIGEALGIKVDWVDATRTVVLGDTMPPVVEPTPAPEPAPAPTAETALSATAGNISKSAPADTPINITWGSATKVTKMLAGSPAFGLTYDPHEGVDYTVTDNGDGTGVFVIKKELANQLPVPLNMVPTGAEMAITVQFDNGTSINYSLKVVD